MSIQTQLDRIKDNVTAAFNAVGNKGGTVPSSKVSDNLESAINTIPTGIVLEELENPGLAETLMKGYELYDDDGTKVTGTMPVAEQATPVISDVDSNGKITASVTQSAGYVSGGTKSATKQLTVQAERLFLPGTGEQRIPSGRYLKGDQIIMGDPNLIPENIKDGVSIFTVLGTFVGSGGSSGGGLPDGFSNLTGGTITPASDTSDGGLNYLEHDLGTAPNFFIITMNRPVSPADHAGYVVAIACFKCKIGNTETLGIYFRPSANGSISQATMNYPGMGNIMFAETQIAYFGSLKAGVEYAWMCGVIEGLA